MSKSTAKGREDKKQQQQMLGMQLGEAWSSFIPGVRAVLLVRAVPLCAHPWAFQSLTKVFIWYFSYRFLEKYHKVQVARKLLESV